MSFERPTSTHPFPPSFADLRAYALANPQARADVQLGAEFFRDDPLRCVRVGLTVNR